MGQIRETLGRKTENPQVSVETSEKVFVRSKSYKMRGMKHCVKSQFHSEKFRNSILRFLVDNLCHQIVVI